MNFTHIDSILLSLLEDLIGGLEVKLNTLTAMYTLYVVSQMIKKISVTVTMVISVTVTLVISVTVTLVISVTVTLVISVTVTMVISVTVTMVISVTVTTLKVYMW